MIVVKLAGGLSNQMFQYAAARRLAIKNNTELRLDITSYDNISPQDTPRNYELDIFRIKASVASAADLSAIAKDMPPTGRYAKRLWQVTRKRTFTFLVYGGQKFTQEVLTAGDNTVLDGWWQSEKYFADVADVIRSDFQYKSQPASAPAKLLATIQNDNQSVSLHIRRGDYVNNPHTNAFHGIMSLNYYQTAVNHIRKTIAKPNIYVISDDLAWCKNNLKLKANLVFVDTNRGANSGAEDMRLMRACRHNIIANSSFSWWGAWLNENPHKVVVAPKKWFADPSIDTSDLVPEKWVRL